MSINNNVHDNNGLGIWYDIDNFHISILHNRVTNNAPYSGIIVEISVTVHIPPFLSASHRAESVAI
jgi:hypothetical protein